MQMNISVLIGAAIIAVLTGCASQPVTPATVGPGPVSMEESRNSGLLQVYTGTEMHMVGDSTYYYPHTSYNILTDSGQRFKFVLNHIGTMDESPTRVSIPAGKYRVVADSSSYGRVTVPVVVSAGRITVVHLDNAWNPPANISTNQLVYLPDGEAIGWQSPGDR